DARRIRAGADRARVAVARVAVRSRAATKAVAMDDTLEAPALRGPGHLDEFALGEHLDGHQRTRLRCITDGAEGPDKLRRIVEAGALRVARLGPRGAQRL